MLRDFYFLLRRLVWGKQGIYLPILNLRNSVKGTRIESDDLDRRLHPHARGVTERSNDIVIEAFQRSGNTFAEIAFRYAQPETLSMAHHHHSPAQIVKAAQLGIPALVIVREPKSAVISARQRAPESSCENLLKDYISFYQSIWPYRSSFFATSFKDVTKDFGSVIRGMNEKLATNFIPFVHNDESQSFIFSEIEKRNAILFGDGKVVESMVARPSKSRADMRNEVLVELDGGENPVLLCEAKALFHKYISAIE